MTSRSVISRTSPTICAFFCIIFEIWDKSERQNVVMLTGLAICYLETKWPYLYLPSVTARRVNSLIKIQLNLLC